MHLLINDTKTLSDLQVEFSNEFPYLKIEFFNTPNTRKEALPKSKMYRSTMKVSECRKIHYNGNLAVDKNNTVAQFEETLWNIFGLSAQVFRKSGNLWIETALTDSWTLERQNDHGMEFSTSALQIEDLSKEKIN